MPIKCLQISKLVNIVNIGSQSSWIESENSETILPFLQIHVWDSFWTLEYVYKISPTLQRIITTKLPSDICSKSSLIEF